MNLKSEVICDICKRFLRDPVYLPCFTVVCNEHVQKAKAEKRHIKCLTCNTSFDTTKSAFTVCKMAASILDKELYLSEEEKSLKNSIQNMLKQIEHLQIEIKPKHDESELKIHQQFSEIRRQIDIRREELKAKIDEIALKLIDQANVKENMFKSKLKEMLLGMKETDIQANKQVLANMIRQPDQIIEKARRLQAEYETNIKDLQKKITDFKNFDVNVSENEFRLGSELQNDSFGSLKGIENIPKIPKISLRVKANGRYVCANSAGHLLLVANRVKVDSWELFELFTNCDNTISLKSMANNKYVMASYAGGLLIANGSLIAKAESIDTSEKFYMVNHPDGTASFRSFINAKFVTVGLLGNGSLTATAINLNDCGKFYIAYH